MPLSSCNLPRRGFGLLGFVVLVVYCAGPLLQITRCAWDSQIYLAAKDLHSILFCSIRQNSRRSVSCIYSCPSTTTQESKLELFRAVRSL
ncbi:hypothetical protein LY76DRAFT_289114 [Colletotrichum caudatum]|nr:hypothetical protein LY76DRAFT_289114 [Colletotrichum caudatum]